MNRIIRGSPASCAALLRLEADRPTLGVCFGAQMMAAALGAEVYAGPRKEVGFAPVAVHDHAKDSPLRHIEDVPVLHWHGDTFTHRRGRRCWPPRTISIRPSGGASLLALQFHAEMGQDPLRGLDRARPRLHRWGRHQRRCPACRSCQNMARARGRRAGDDRGGGWRGWPSPHQPFSACIRLR
jgi:GMP synthase-like glutamine amidotransferase